MFEFRPLKLSRLIQALWGAFWIGVAALHVYLFIKRLVAGQWSGGLDQARLILTLAGAAYAVYLTVGIGDVVRWLDRSPRKLLATLLLIVVAHFGALPSAAEAGFGSSANSGWTYIILAVPFALGLALFGSAALKASRDLAKHRIPLRAAIPELRGERAVEVPYDLRRRPPPHL